jgi:uncharacterized protein YjeT (DUF2065 family)
MRWARSLVLLSAAVLAVTGIGYLLVPASMLAIVGVASTTTTDFLLRTEGVALLAGAGFLWAIRDGDRRQLGVALTVLSAYYVLSSAVDIAALIDGVVGPASVPSAVVRIALGVVCLVLAARMDTGPGQG